MSRNITIQEGGVGKQLTVDKLKTNLVGGGTCLWVPEDDVALGSKRITENGTYRASDDGFYGYSQVTVTGIGVATGKKQDGKEYTVMTDANGNLVEKSVPTSIAITTNPTKTAYDDGEQIDYTGMVVTAYDANGDVWDNDGAYPNGVIPIADLNLPETVADASKVEKEVWANGGGIIAWKLTSEKYRGSRYYIIDTPLGERNGNVYTIGTGDEADSEATLLLTRYNGELYVARIEGNGAHFGLWRDENGQWNFSGGSSYRTKWQRFDSAVWHNDITYPPNSAVDPGGHSTGDMRFASGGQTIPVEFYRPGGDKLETHFMITVTVSETPQGEITRAEVEQAITTAQLLGLDVVYIRGVEYTMAEAIALRNSLS
ncbi:MAG: hypothetical protein IJH86_03345 [Clostridia bacterium]|nr:hypothetical protein [Clostridia bacterium]